MLTKDLLRFKTQGDKIIPKQLKGTPKEQEVVESMLSVFLDSAGCSSGGIEGRLEDLDCFYTSNYKAFLKILLDLCTFQENVDIRHERFELLKAAQKLRCEKPFSTHQAFLEEFAEQWGKPLTGLQSWLYGDLPQYKPLGEFKAVPADEVFVRYNCAQIQGLVLRCHSLEIRFTNLSLLQKRQLFRIQKFHGLIPEILYSKGKALTYVLGGPLSVVGQKQAYGYKLARFIPYLPHFGDWSLSAQVAHLGRDYLLEVNSDEFSKTYYKHPKGFIPDEFSTFVTHMNDKLTDWKIVEATELLHLGEQAFCFPDFTVVSSCGKKVQVELFHQWNAGELGNRIKILEKYPNQELLLGICRKVSKQKKFVSILDDSLWFQKRGFLFSGFPSVKGLSSVLNSSARV